MKKILLLSLLSIFAFAACKNEPHYQINGTVSDYLNDKTVYLQKKDSVHIGQIVDSVVIKDGKFTMKGILAKPDFYNVSVKDTRVLIELFVENTPIDLKIDIEEPQVDVKINYLD